MREKLNKGFTLIELMITISIVAIIASIAYPSYQNHITRVRASEAQAQLLDVMQRQRKFYSEQNRFTVDLTDIFPAAALTDSGGLLTEQGFHAITSAPCGEQPLTACVDLIATPTGRAAVGTVFRYNSLNQKRPLEEW